MLDEPGQRWFTAQGPYVDNGAMLDILMTQGGVFDSADPAPANSDAGTVGSIELEFYEIAEGTFGSPVPPTTLWGTIRITLDSCTSGSTVSTGR